VKVERVNTFKDRKLFSRRGDAVLTDPFDTGERKWGEKKKGSKRVRGMGRVRY